MLWELSGGLIQGRGAVGCGRAGFPEDSTWG